MRKNRSPAWQTARRIFALVQAAILLGAAVKWFHPARIPWVEDRSFYVEAQAVKDDIPLIQLDLLTEGLRAQTLQPVDARSAEEYARAHLPGALSLPLESAEELSVLMPVLRARRPLVIYGSGYEAADALLLARQLRGMGRVDAALFVGGMELWEGELRETEGEAFE
jgi:rhodanese-related sulfurtransferase